jgi:hypothetical protein
LKIDFAIVSQIVAGIVLLVAGALINRFFEKRARVVAFYSHLGEFRLQPQGLVRTHTVVIRNDGRAPAQNVHVPHHGQLSTANIHISIDPAMGKVQTAQNGTEEIFFEKLPAKFQVSVSYLYFPPLVAAQINAPIYSDEGAAKIINVLPQQQWPMWAQRTALGVLIVGAITILYALFALLRWMA